MWLFCENKSKMLDFTTIFCYDDILKLFKLSENEEKMLEAIFSLIEDKEKRENLIKNTKKSMSKFKSELICDEWFRFICEVCSNEKNY